MPIHIIYHAHCADGFGSAYAAWLHFGEKAVYWPASHGEAPPDVTGQQVYILDFSYPRPIMEVLAAQAQQITILDHHQSAQENLTELLDNNLIDGFFDLSRSGAMISWEYFHTTPAPALIQYIQDRDLWRYALPHTQAISMALQMVPKTFTAWTPLMHNIEPLITAGQPILAFFEAQIDSLVSQAFRMTIAGYDVPAVNAPGLFASDLGNKLTHDEPFAAVFQESEKQLNFSLRSTDAGVDVAQVAAKFGGGGHRNASGFRILKTNRDLLAEA